MRTGTTTSGRPRPGRPASARAGSPATCHRRLLRRAGQPAQADRRVQLGHHRVLLGAVEDHEADPPAAQGDLGIAAGTRHQRLHDAGEGRVGSVRPARASASPRRACGPVDTA